MADYKTMYLTLAGAQADALEALADAQNKLIKAQLEAEALYIGHEPHLVPFPIDATEKTCDP